MPWTEPTGDSAPRPPVRLSLGEDALSGSEYASARLSGDRRSFNATLRGVSEATLRVDDLVRARNHEDVTYLIELKTARLVDPRLVAARLLVGSESVDLLTGEPSVMANISAGTTVRIGFEMTFAGVDEEAIVASQPVELTIYRP